MSVRVVLADHHRMLREALRALLAVERDIDVVGEAGDGRETLCLLQELEPDVLVLDAGLPGVSGAEVARRLRAASSPVKVLALSAHSDKRFVQEMLRAGAAGYLTKTAAGTELVRAIRAVALGESFLSPEVARTVLNDYACACGAETHAPPPSCLGARERDVLKLIADGEHSPAIASRLGIAVGTVDVHRRNLMRKLDLHTVAKLTKYAIREGLTAP
jgi:two-component system NarL family response regulator